MLGISIEDVNDGYDKISKSTRKDCVRSSETSDGRARAHVKTQDTGNGHFGAEAGASAALIKDGFGEGGIAKCEAKTDLGCGGVSASANAGLECFKTEGEIGRLDIMNTSLGGELGFGSCIKAKAGANVEVVKGTAKFGGGKELSANVGLNTTTGFEFGSEGIGLSFMGVGGTIGIRKIAIQTPFAGGHFKFW